MRATGFLGDGRWVAVGLLLAYYAILGLSGPGADLVARWRLAGVYAHPAPFVDLHVGAGELLRDRVRGAR